MNYFLLTIFRNRKKTFISFLTLFALPFIINFWYGQTIKITTYFTVVPLDNNQQSNHFYAAEGSEKFSEVIAGWAKNPNFRNKILDIAQLKIDNFKRKIFARQQNRFNVFFTIDLPINFKDKEKEITEALQQVITDQISEFNRDSIVKFSTTKITSQSELWFIPWAWTLVISLILGFFGATAIPFLWENFLGKLNNKQQLKEIFSESEILTLSSFSLKDSVIFEKFITSFSSPKIISLSQQDLSMLELTEISLIGTGDTPILIVALGETSLPDLENMQSILGSQIGIILLK